MTTKAETFHSRHHGSADPADDFAMALNSALTSIDPSATSCDADIKGRLGKRVKFSDGSEADVFHDPDAAAIAVLLAAMAEADGDEAEGDDDYDDGAEEGDDI